MLDDLKMIHSRDAHDALGIVEKQSKQLQHTFDVSGVENKDIENIVYAGMGGSALAAHISKIWPGYDRPFEIVRDYDLPGYVTQRTLCIVASYSGNTEETLSALRQAEDKGARIVVIAGGGKLTEIAREKGYPLAVLPKTEQPRYAVLYNLKAILDILDAAGIVSLAELQPELDSAMSLLDTSVAAWKPEIPTANNPAKQVAQELMGRSLVVYSGPLLAPAAYKWKISFNENAKQVAWLNQFPEFNHNEFIGWSKQPVDKPYAVIDLRSNLEHPRVQKRFEVSEWLLSGMRPAPIIVNAKGDTLAGQLFWTLAFGDFVSIYLGLLNGLDPAPVELVEKFKKVMDE
ncbi:MAG TPA: bifunctional phosphoglucose/phosphomannose isomerase [Candidatus Saccharimonadales bacterium]|nr:bifunctional phosphoglucose/phosphomannose isomerase [Candidatus Saccharimonadales bacterium]